MGGYYDRQGQPMEMEDWAANVKDKRVAATVLPNGYWVSTVWLGIDHSFSMGGPPIIFETMVFPCDAEGAVISRGEVESNRYSTEEEALAGHERIVAEWSTKPRYEPKAGD